MTFLCSFAMRALHAAVTSRHSHSHRLYSDVFFEWTSWKPPGTSCMCSIRCLWPSEGHAVRGLLSGKHHQFIRFSDQIIYTCIFKCHQPYIFIHVLLLQSLFEGFISLLELINGFLNYLEIKFALEIPVETTESTAIICNLCVALKAK